MFESPSRVLFDRDPAIAQAIQGELTRERRWAERKRYSGYDITPAVSRLPCAANPAGGREHHKNGDPHV